MSSIDERIVIIKFDNDQFEKNVEQSSKTLDKLKEKLKLDGATKGLESVSATAKSFSLGGVGDAIDSIRERFSTLGVIGMTVVQNLTNKFVDFATKIGGQMVSGGVKRALNFEQAEFMLEGLLSKYEDGEQKIEEIMAAANNAVTGTAYGLDEAAKVASQLVASGIEDGKKMEFILTGVSGAAAMTGSSYSEMGDIFTTVAGNGRLMTEQLRQFSHRGLNVAATLAQELNTTEADIREMVTKGQIDFEMFADAMANAFGPQAQKANKTFTGSLSNVKAALSRLGAKVATEELHNLRDIFNVLGPLIDSVSAALQPFIDLINNVLHKSSMRAVSSLTKLYLAFGGSVKKLQEKTQYASEDAIAQINSTVDSFEDLANGTGNFFTKLREKITGVAGFTNDAAEEMEDSSKSIAASAEEIDEAARKVLRGDYGNGEERRQQLEALGLSYELVQNKVNELLGCEYRYEVQTEDVTDAVNDAAKGFDTAAERVEKFARNSRESSKEIEKTVGPLENFAAGFRNIGQTLSRFFGIIGDSFTRVFSDLNIGGAIQTLSEGFRSFTNNLTINKKEAKGLSAIFDGLFSVVKAGIKVADYALTIIGKIINGIVTLAGHLLEFIGAVRESERFQAFLSALGNILSKVGEAIISFKDAVVDAARSLAKTEGFQKLRDVLSTVWEIIKELAGSVFDKVIGKMNEFGSFDPNMSWLDKIVELLGSGAGHLADFIQSFIDGTNPIQMFLGSFKENATSGFGKFVELIIKVKDAVVQFFSGLFGDGAVTASIGQEGGLTGWFQTLFGNLLTNAGEFFKGINTSSFVEGIKTFFTTVLENLKDVDWQQVTTTISEIGEVIAKLIVLVEGFKTLSAAKSMFESAAGAFESMKGMFGSIGDFFQNEEKGLPALIKGYKKNSNAKVVLSIAALIAAIAGSLYVVSKIPADDLTRSVKSLGVLLVAVAAIFVAIDKMKISSGSIKSFGLGMTGLGAGVLLLTVTAKRLSEMPKDTFKSGALRILAFVAMLTAAAKIAGQSRAAASFMGLALAIDLLIPALLILGNMDWEKIKKAIIAIGFVMAELSIAVAAAGGGRGGGQLKVAAAFMGLAFAIDLLVPALLILGNLKTETLIKGGVAIAALMFSLAGAIRLASSPVSSKGATNMLKMTVPLIAAIVGLKVLADVPWQQLAGAAGSLVGVVMGLALALKLAKGGGKGADNMLKMTVPLVAAIVGLKLLADVPIKQMVVSAALLVGIIMSLVAAYKLCEGGSKGADNMLKLTVPLAVACAGLAVLANMPMEGVIAGAAAIAGVMLAIAGAAKFAKNAQAGAAAMLLVTPTLIVVCVGLAKLAEYPWENIAVAGAAIGGTMLAVAGALALLGKAGPSAFLGVAVFDALIVSLVAIAAIMGELFGEGGKFEGAMKKAIPVLEDFGTAIGGFLGNLIEGVGEGVAKSIERLGEALGYFGEQIGPFIEAAKGIDASVMSGIGELVVSMLEITGGELVEKLGSLIIGDDVFTTFGQQLLTFSVYLSKFAENVDPAQVASAVSGAQIAIGMYGTLEASGIKGGVLGVLQGNPLKHLGLELSYFSEAVQDIQAVKTGVITNIVAASAPAAGMYKILKASGIKGGVLGVLQGNPLKHLGKEIKYFSDATQGIQNVNAGIVKNIAEAAVPAATMYRTLKASGIKGGLEGVLDGNPLKHLGKELTYFADAVQDIKSVKTGVINSISDVLPALITSMRRIDNADITNSNITAFSDSLEYLGPKIKSYSGSLKTVLTGKMQTVAGIIPDVVTMLKQMSAASVSNADTTADTLVSVGGKIKTFAENIAGVSASQLQAVSSSVAQIAAMQSQVETASSSITSNLTSSMQSAASTAVTNLTSALSSGSGSVAVAMGALVAPINKALTELPGKFKTFGSTAATDFVNALKSGASGAASNASALASSAVNGLSSALGNNFATYAKNAVDSFINSLSATYRATNAGSTLGGDAVSGLASGAAGNNTTTPYSVGHDIVSGFGKGIRENSWISKGAAETVAQEAIDAARKKFRVGSPSRVFYEIGGFVVAGLANGLRDGVTVARDASERLSEAVIKAAEKPVNNFQNAIVFDLDVNPTITPVLDLSEIRKGAGQIGGLLNAQTPRFAFAGAGTGSMAMNNLAAISNSMRMAESGNGDVVDAINGLKNKTGNYTFNITVDGTESPEDFVNKLVRIVKNRSRI